MTIAGALVMVIACVMASPAAGESLPASSAAAAVVRQLDANGFDTCVLLPDGSPQCWGQGFANGENQPTGTYAEIGVGGGGGCGLTTSPGPVSCWSLPTTGHENPPPSSGSYSAIAGGNDDDCALSVAGTVTCWGPFAVTVPGPFTAVADGSGGGCAITTAGALDCFNYGGGGAFASPPAGTYTAVTVGVNFACALGTDQGVSCWGDNTYGQTGAPAGNDYVAVSAGAYFACALRTTGTITCWGSNALHQLSSPSGKFTSISAGGFHACAVASTGYVRCWGDDRFGQVGAAPYLNPAPIPGGLADNGYFADLGLPNVTVTGDRDGNPPGTFTVSHGIIPPGLSLDPLYGLLQGTTTTPGSFPFTVSISNVQGAVSVRYHVIVLGFFLGFRQPAAGARIAPSARALAVSFRLGRFAGALVPPKYAGGLQLLVSLSRSSKGAHPVAKAACRYVRADRSYHCTLRLTHRLARGRYYLTAYQQSGHGYVPCPDGNARTDRNPEQVSVR